MDGKTALGASSPENPALHMPDPLSTTSAAVSSSHILVGRNSKCHKKIRSSAKEGIVEEESGNYCKNVFVFQKFHYANCSYGVKRCDEVQRSELWSARLVLEDEVKVQKSELPDSSNTSDD